MKRSAAFSALFILSIFALSVPSLLSDSAGHISAASAQSEAGVRHKVIGCAKEPRGECAGDECNCSKWIIEWRDPSGRVWGVSEAKTLQKLVESRDRDLAFERAYASFFHVAFDQKFANPSQPICDGCRPSAPSGATRSGVAAIQTAASLYDEWTRKAAEGMLSLTNVIFGRQATYLNSPYRNAGTVLRDYANAVRLVNMNLKHLRQDMSFTERQLGRLTGNLQGSMAELRQATDVMTTAYANLPSDVRNALEGKSSTAEVLTSLSTSDESASIVGSVLVVQEGHRRSEAPLAELDFERTYVETKASGRAVIWIYCRRESGSMNPCFNATLDSGEELMSKPSISLWCDSQQQCEAFLNGLRRSARSPR